MSVEQSMSQLGHEKVRAIRTYFQDKRDGKMKNIPEDPTRSHIIRTVDDSSSGWPYCTFFVLIVELCERFCYYGLRQILILFIQEYLGKPEDIATQWYHYYGAACYFSPLVGAVIADSIWGRYKTIKLLSFVYILGTIFLTLSALPTWLFEASGPDRTIHQYLMIAGLALIAAGAGGIKPCVAAFGADQFPLHAVRSKENYFKWFYMLINIGAAISSFITPRMKAIDCYPNIKSTDANIVEMFHNEDKQLAFDSCHVSAYGMSAALMIIALSLFLLPPVLATYYFKNNKDELGEKFTYKKFEMKKENIMKEVSYATYTAIVGKFTSSKKEEKADEGFLIYSKHSSARVRRASFQVCKLALLYAPITIFWFLFEQVGSLWVFQAKEMDGWVIDSWYIAADQIGVLNPILVMALIPLWTIYMSPMVEKLFYKNPETLKKKPLHMLFVGLLFTLGAGWVTYQLQVTIDDNLTFPDHGKIKQGLFKTSKDITLNLTAFKDNYQWNDETIYKIPDGVDHVATLSGENETFKLNSEYKNTIYYFYKHVENNQTELKMYIINGAQTNQQQFGRVEFYKADKSGKVVQYNVAKAEFKNETVAESSEEGLKEDDTESFKIDLKGLGLFGKYKNGAKYVINSDGSLELVVRPRKVNMAVVFWNYLLLTFGEIMISTTCLEFSYTQAPTQMKTVCTALFYLTITVAHFIDVGLQELKTYPRKSLMLISCGLLVVDTVCYVLVAWSFTVLDVDDVLYLDRPDGNDFEDEEHEKLKLSDGHSESSQMAETKIIDPFKKG